MNTLEPPPIPAAPAPLLRNRIPPDYRKKVRRFTVAQRDFYARSAWRRVIALELTAAIAAILADIRYELPAAWRWSILGILAATGVGLLALWWWWPALRLSESRVIRRLEHLLPELGQRLRTSREAENATCSPGLTGVFASGLVADTRVRVSHLDLTALIPWKTIRLLLYACLAMQAIFLGLFASWPDFRVGAHRLITPGAGATFTSVEIEDAPGTFKEGENPLISAVVSGRPVQETLLFTREEGQEWKAQKMDRVDAAGHFQALLTGRKDSFEYYAAAGDGHSETRRMKCLLTPRIEKVVHTVELPDYIGGPPIKGAGGDVKAVEGSTVTVDFEVNPPLVEATAYLNDGRNLPLKVAGSHVLFELKVARGEVVYELTGSDEDHLYLPPTKFKITGFEDKPPEVELVEPKKDLTATTVWEILARLRAKDDFGLAEVGIVLVVGNEIKMIAHREIAEKSVRTVSEMGTAALEEFPLTLNDNLKIYAFARDHKPRDGARSVSRLVAIDIRQFQVRWRLVEGGGGGGGLPMSGEHLADLLGLIKEQRKIVSDTFMLTENGVPEGGDLGAVCEKIRSQEDTAAARATKLKQKVDEEGTMNADDLTLLDTAAQQMKEASSHLEQKLPRPAYKQADRALSSLLALRKKIMRLMSQNKSAMPSNAEERPKATSVSDLAAEAERLAREEHEVREKITPKAPDARDLDVVRHQQEVAVTDAGELFAALVRHPASSELALQRMESAEDLMQKAEDQMKGAAAQEAGPGLKSAEDLLIALAAQLRALDEKNMEETMGKLAQMAKEAQERMEQEQKQRGSEKGAKKQDKASQNEGAQTGEKPKASNKQGENQGAKNEGQKNAADAGKNSDAAATPDAQEKGQRASASQGQKGDANEKAEASKAAGDTANNAGDSGQKDAGAAGDKSKDAVASKENEPATGAREKGDGKAGQQSPAAEDQKGNAGAKSDASKAAGDTANKAGDSGQKDAGAAGDKSKDAVASKENEPATGAREKGDGKAGQQSPAAEDQKGNAGAKSDASKAAGDAANNAGDSGQKDAGAAGDKATAKENGTAAGQHEKGQLAGAQEKGDGKTGKKGKGGPEQSLGIEEKGRENGAHAKAAGTGPGGLEKTAENAATIDDALKALAGREDAGKEGERLTELREQANTGALKSDVQALGGEKNDAAASEKAGELGRRFGKLAAGLNAEQRRLLQSHIEALTDLLTRTRKLEQQVGEKSANVKNGKGEAQQQQHDQAKADGGKGEEKGEGKTAGTEGKQPGDPQPGGADEKPADEKTGKNSPTGTDTAEKQNEKLVPDAPQPNGEKVGTGPQPGRRIHERNAGGGGAQRAHGPHGGVRDIDPIRDEYLKDLDRVADARMRGVLAPLIEDAEHGAFDYSHLQAMAEHLAKMLDDLVRDKSGGHQSGGVPDEYSHLVDDYFRALSEDDRSGARTPSEPSSPRK